MKNESGSPVTKPGGSFFRKVVLRGGRVSCVQTGVRRAVVCIQQGEATGNVEVSKASVVTWAPRGTERQSSGAGHEGRREPRLGNEE